jgi:comEA protein
MKRISTITLITSIALFLTIAFLSATGECASLKGKTVNGQLNINTATVEELTLLPRIGQKVAERIIAYRKDKGSFKNAEELKNVKGIGDKTFAKLAPLVKISGQTDLRIEGTGGKK